LHFPVLLREVIVFLDPEPGDVIVDATLGGGGHAAETLKNIIPGGSLIAFDRDPEAIARSRKVLSAYEKDITYINEDFRNLESVARSMGIGAIDGAVFDLGISSYQVDEAERGFSFLRDGPLDMRFDNKGGLTAQEVVNGYGKEELAGIIGEYGEERHAMAVAQAIVRARKISNIRTTGELAEIVKRAVGYRYKKQRLHPACRTFQAIRMHVNDEMGAIESGVRGALSLLRPGARICVISFHSIEDRAVKNIFKHYKKMGDVTILTKKPARPSCEETSSNPRSRSAKLRVAEKIR
jgi:16S rRNA (cytosine1402-N4)-methyltransferase